MPRSQPSEDATFPVYKVQAKCPKCGKQGETKALRQYPDGTVIEAKCSACVKTWEASVKRLGKPRPLGEMRTKRQHDPSKKEGAWLRGVSTPIVALRPS